LGKEHVLDFDSPLPAYEEVGTYPVDAQMDVMCIRVAQYGGILV
jgi:hypothetical protein